ncbi:TauD/TfdA family dioxygenase [Pseudomonas laurylsulfatiphila]|jgi:Fe(II)/alpha-ketoglutarate-dependent arginine beta-hydroxylase|uniref:TauD/TfdA family dioxygenase n=1 Tax=Pseudomonas laurylsulfatiphila TaxID=2011015 RepID=UPI00215DE4C2|nr:TauD/TfdA family dioxygenase [Pseudomonas laurylsulfatiphila]MDF9905501.1 Fe(II)/alpha-ketoglutarate-dependent arginine beta-hydroxylase [Pseudomonas reinekei]UVM06272.1 TauD/TfdA family dioxygenase [Pseudomonas laurylsulfatiphila]
MIDFYTLDSKEYQQVDTLISSIKRTVSNDNHLHQVALHASQDMPRSLRAMLAEFRGENLGAALRIGGFQIDDSLIGATPSSTNSTSNRPIMREDIYLVLMAYCLGIPYSFVSQQSGYLTQNIVPMKSAELTQLGAGSKEELVWHTEDAFSDNRPDFILLLGLRNPQNVATTVCAFPPETDKEDIEVLFSKNFYFLPDSDHANHLAQATSEAARAAYLRMQKMLNNPTKESILFGDRTRPYMRIDPKFMEPANIEDKSVAAFSRLADRIDSAQQDIVINPGELLIVDNHRAVHGRRLFIARYDDRDRWLKKINVTQDFKRMREYNVHERSFAI